MFKQFYIYLVLFATLMMTIGGAVSIFMTAADIISPTTYMEVNVAKNQLIKSFGFIIIPFPIFLYFNRLRKKLE